jgi:hypothetical protein
LVWFGLVWFGLVVYVQILAVALPWPYHFSHPKHNSPLDIE